MALHDTSSNSPWPDPRDSYTRVRLENTGWTMVELAVPVEDIEDSSELIGKRKPIYTRISQQNNTDHLRGFASSASNGSVGTNSKSSTSNTTGAGSNLGALLAGGLVTGDNMHGQQLSANSQSGASKAVNAYDAKHMMRELERAGNSTSLLSGSMLGSTSTLVGSTATNPGNEGKLAPPIPNSSATPIISSPSNSIATAQSPAGVALSPNLNLATAPSAWSDLWQSICVRVLPLFNDEDLKGHVEDVNESVSTHIHRTLDRSPARAMDALSKDLYALCATGMYTLNARLNMHFHDDFRLLEALTEIWTMFFTNIVPWLEACFLPLQTDATLASLSKGDDKPLSSLQTEPIDIRKVALTAFRDHILIPWFDRILPLFLHVGDFDIDLLSHHRTRQKPRQEKEERLLYPRLMQMINIFGSVLTSDEAKFTLDELLRALRIGNDSFLAAMNPHQHAGLTNHNRDQTSSSSAAVTASREKRNYARHGWLPKSAAKHGHKAATDGGNESAYLSSLKSPITEDPTDTPTSSMHDLEDNGSNNNNNNDEYSNYNLEASLQENQSEEGEERTTRLLDSKPSLFAPLQESAVGLGLPSLDQWDDGEERG